jgi:glutamate formiminotransferase
VSEPLFEIVPNLSEGRDSRPIDEAVALVEKAGARVLHRTSDAAHHRSVITAVGGGEAVLAASVALAGFAAERIDLREHRGVHPRIGALDVLPFVPLDGATMEQAAELAHRAGRQIWERHHVPSFYYGAAARRDERRLLANVRKGEFEGLYARFPHHPPDEGDVAAHASAGAIAIGARPLLVAFNVVLETGDLAAARMLARRLREGGGGLRTLRALAFRLAPGRVQLSFNLTDYRATPLHRVVAMVRTLAAADGISAGRGELIGCLPRDAVEASASFYLGVLEPAS